MCPFPRRPSVLLLGAGVMALIIVAVLGASFSSALIEGVRQWLAQTEPGTR